MEPTAPLIREASDDDVDLVRELFWEYLQWANDKVTKEFGVSFDIASMLEQDMVALEKFAPPTGRMLLATINDRVVGIGCLKRLLPEVGEIKRMYVRPESRGTGLGRAMLEALTSSAESVGYSRIRLDSAGFMTVAHGLYRSAGFREIEPYPESEIPPEFHEHWVFMERELEGS